MTMVGTSLTPFEWQRNALDKLREARASGADRALVVMATGLGKTFTAAWFVEEWLRDQPQARILVVADKKNLLDQFDADLTAVLGAHDVCTMTFQSLRTRINKHVMAGDYDLVIVDEAHHTGAITYSEIAEYLSPKFILGLTATPERGDGVQIDKWFGEALIDESLEKALALGHLASVHYSVIADDLARDGVIEVEGMRLTRKQIDESIFGKERHEAMMEILHERLTKINPTRTLIFCKNVAHAELIANEIDGAVAIHGAQQNAGKLIADFRNGKIATVCAVNLFNEGIDVPSVDCLVFLRSTASPTVWKQQLGRGLRRSTNKDTTHVLDFAANCDRLESIIKLHEEIDEIQAAELQRLLAKEPINEGSRSTVSDDEVLPSTPTGAKKALNITDERNGETHALEGADSSSATYEKGSSPSESVEDEPGSMQTAMELPQSIIFDFDETVVNVLDVLKKIRPKVQRVRWNREDCVAVGVRFIRKRCDEGAKRIFPVKSELGFKSLPSENVVNKLFGSLREYKKQLAISTGVDWRERNRTIGGLNRPGVLCECKTEAEISVCPPEHDGWNNDPGSLTDLKPKPPGPPEVDVFDLAVDTAADTLKHHFSDEALVASLAAEIATAMGFKGFQDAAHTRSERVNP